MKINLSNISVKRSLFATEEEHINAAKIIAEEIYKTCNTLEEKLFAEKLFTSEEIEVNESERQLILSRVEKLFFWLRDPILKIID